MASVRGLHVREGSFIKGRALSTSAVLGLELACFRDIPKVYLVVLRQRPFSSSMDARKTAVFSDNFSLILRSSIYVSDATVYSLLGETCPGKLEE